MKNLLAFALLFIAFVTSAQDSGDCKDNPLFSRMPHTHIGDCSTHIEEMEIPVKMDKNENLEGTKHTIEYTYEESETSAPSFLQVVKHYENEISNIGGKRIYYSKESGVATLYAKSNGKDIWVVLHDFGGGKKGNYQFNILELPCRK